MNSPPKPILELAHVSVQFAKSYLFKNLSLTLSQGSILGLRGPTGSGKTVLLRLIAGLIQLQQGSVYLLGKSITEYTMPHYRSQVMYVSQTPALWDGTVEECLKQVYHLAIHQDKSFNRPWILEQLARFQRSESFLQQTTALLSGGERQLVALLRAIQLNPLVLLLDEPTAALDPAATHEAEQLVLTWLNQTTTRGGIWVSHVDEQCQRLCTDFLTLGHNS